jgi:acetyl-CoA carboxylase biotin carboxyl carrier protein
MACDRQAPVPSVGCLQGEAMTLSLDQVGTLSDWLTQAGLDRLELTGPGFSLQLSRTASPNGTPASQEPLLATPVDDAAVETVRSPGIGRFLRAHPLHRDGLVKPDQPVKAGQPVGLLQAGTILSPVLAPRAGIVAEIIAVEGALLGWGDPILSLWPEE